MLLYSFLKIVVKIALGVFFRRFQVQNAHFLNTDGPLIVVGNHPNTFMDPLIAAVLMRQRVAFVGNASIFNRFTRPIFNYFHVIPIYRVKDMTNVDAPGVRTELNNRTFAKCFDYLAKGGTILIFPEGTSEIERRLRQIKTGMARIALGAESQHDFGLGVKILPMGLNYSDPTRFRSDIFVNVSEPIVVKDLKEKYQHNDFETVEELTDLIEQRFRTTTIVTEDQEEDEVVKKIEVLYKNQLLKKLNLNPDRQQDDFMATNRIIAWVRSVESNQSVYKNFKQTLDSYTESLEILGISDHEFVQHKHLRTNISLSVLGLLLGLPFYIFGLITNYLPYILPSKITQFITRDISYRAPAMMSLGILTFPLCYAIEGHLVAQYVLTQWWTVLFVFSLPLAGYFVLYYWGFWAIPSALGGGYGCG